MKKKITIPFAYFITFSTYGTWLHGDKRGSVDLKNNNYITQRIKPNENFEKHMRQNRTCEPFILNEKRRLLVLSTIQKTCDYYHWRLYAAHIRTNHVHVVLSTNESPEKIMTQLKSYASRALKEQDTQDSKKRYWTRHGSTRFIWSSSYLYPAMYYVIDRQGKKMACFFEDWYEKPAHH